jgi:endonuclease/exonuclease/phosphatase family metal-dependent hydrolase
MSLEWQAKHDTLTLCEYNLENLFISMEYYEGQDLADVSEEEWRRFALAQLQRRQKPLSKVLGISQAIDEINADVLLLTEVGGKDSLDNLNRYFLQNQYDVYFVEGNSTRGIDLGFMVKKNLPYVREARSNRDTPVEVHTYQGKYVTRFSRDVAELRLYDGEDLKWILLLVHLKSMLSTEQDYKGKDVRTAEAMALAEIYQELQQEHPLVPIIVGGDFNTELSSLELELLKRTDLSDFQDCINTPHDERVTLVHFEVDGTPRPHVLDYLLISPHLCERIVKEKSYAYRYKTFYDIREPLPDQPQTRYRQPSDHYPLVLTLRV